MWDTPSSDVIDRTMAIVRNGKSWKISDKMFRTRWFAPLPHNPDIGDRIQAAANSISPELSSVSAISWKKQLWGSQEFSIPWNECWIPGLETNLGSFGFHSFSFSTAVSLTTWAFSVYWLIRDPFWSNLYPRVIDENYLNDLELVLWASFAYRVSL